MNAPIMVISGPVTKGRSKSISEFLKTSPESILKCEMPAEIIVSQASWRILWKL